MHFIIDGYNLLFRLPETPHSIEERRNALIEHLKEASDVLIHELTIVFDGHLSGNQEVRFYNLTKIDSL